MALFHKKTMHPIIESAWPSFKKNSPYWLSGISSGIHCPWGQSLCLCGVLSVWGISCSVKSHVWVPHGNCRNRFPASSSYVSLLLCRASFFAVACCSASFPLSQDNTIPSSWENAIRNSSQTSCITLTILGNKKRRPVHALPPASAFWYVDDAIHKFRIYLCMAFSFSSFSERYTHNTQ